MNPFAIWDLYFFRNGMRSCRHTVPAYPPPRAPPSPPSPIAPLPDPFKYGPFTNDVTVTTECNNKLP